MADPIRPACSASCSSPNRSPIETLAGQGDHSQVRCQDPGNGPRGWVDRPVEAVVLALGQLDCIQLPRVRNAFESARATIGEHKAGPGDQVLDRTRAPDLPSPG